MDDFHKTPMGRKFFEQDIPDIVDGLKKTVEVLGKGMETLEVIARDLRDKHVGEEGWKIGQIGKFNDAIIFTACLDDGTSYSIGQVLLEREVRYYLYMDDEHVPNKSVDSFSKFYEALDALADEASLD